MFYYTSDLHFNHSKIMQYCNRPFPNVEEMNKALIVNWNSRVQNKDTVFILGDFGFLDGEQANNLLKQLKGKKVLIVGNHDIFLRKKGFNENLFEEIRAIKNVRDPSINNNLIVLCHYPMAVWDRKDYGTYHFYGHVHNNTIERHPYLLGAEYTNAFNVGTDCHNYFPVTAQEIINSGAK